MDDHIYAVQHHMRHDTFLKRRTDCCRALCAFRLHTIRSKFRSHFIDDRLDGDRGVFHTYRSLIIFGGGDHSMAFIWCVNEWATVNLCILYARCPNWPRSKQFVDMHEEYRRLRPRIALCIWIYTQNEMEKQYIYSRSNVIQCMIKRFSFHDIVCWKKFKYFTNIDVY